MTSEEEKEKLKNYLNNRLKECEQNIQRLTRKYKTVKILFATTLIITITSSTVIAGLSSTVLPPLGITILKIVGTLSGALSVKFILKKQKTRLQDAIRESNAIKK